MIKTSRVCIIAHQPCRIPMLWVKIIPVRSSTCSGHAEGCTSAYHFISGHPHNSFALCEVLARRNLFLINLPSFVRIEHGDSGSDGFNLRFYADFLYLRTRDYKNRRRIVSHEYILDMKTVVISTCRSSAIRTFANINNQGKSIQYSRQSDKGDWYVQKQQDPQQILSFLYQICVSTKRKQGKQQPGNHKQFVHLVSLLLYYMRLMEGNKQKEKHITAESRLCIQLSCHNLGMLQLVRT